MCRSKRRGEVAVGPRWDDGHLSCCLKGLDHAFVGIERLVGDQHVGLYLGQEVVGADQVVCLASGQVEADRIAEGIQKHPG